LGDTAVVLTVGRQLADVVFVGEYQPGGHIWKSQLNIEQCVTHVNYNS
jgi:hypothetical protein